MRARVVVVPEEDSPVWHRVLVVYCRGCGEALGVVPPYHGPGGDTAP
jgi:hypothetical protein